MGVKFWIEKDGCMCADLTIVFYRFFQAEGRPTAGDTLEKGPDNPLAALAQRLEDKYGVREIVWQRIGFVC